MPDIDIGWPISLKTELLELENHMPYIRMGVQIITNHATGSFSYNAVDLWFECTL